MQDIYAKHLICPIQLNNLVQDNVSFNMTQYNMKPSFLLTKLWIVDVLLTYVMSYDRQRDIMSTEKYHIWDNNRDDGQTNACGVCNTVL